MYDQENSQHTTGTSLDLAFKELQIPHDSYIYSFTLTAVVTNIQS